MRDKILNQALNYMRLTVEYFRIVFSGVIRLYIIVGSFLLERLRPFSKIELVYYIVLTISVALTAADWRSYDLILNSEIVHHGISTDDFVFFIAGFLLMAVPGIIKIVMQIEYRNIFIGFFSTGIIINVVIYILNALQPERIAKTREASFSIWFFLFGFFLLCCGILGVLSILSMPSTHSKNERL